MRLPVGDAANAAAWGVVATALATRRGRAEAVRAALAAKQAGEQMNPAHWSGVGQKKLMRCSGKQNYQCWNGIEINGHVAATKLTEAIFTEIANLPAFDDTILAKARQQWLQLHGDLDVKKTALEHRKNELISKVA